jgi:cell division protein FtsI (penicillin-binding protein 3)
MTERGQRLRVFGLVALFCASLAGLGIRLAYLHLDENPALRARIQHTREVEQPLLVGRGRILDRTGKILALDLVVKNVVVDPEVIQEKGAGEQITAHLARLLQLDPAMVASHVNRANRRFEYVTKRVHEDLARQVADLKLDGVFFEDVSARYYPRGSLMGHVIGFSNADGVGSAGIEQRFDKYLKGVPGLRVTEVDGKRREIYTHRGLEIQPQKGADVLLTLDQNLQYAVERALDAAIEAQSAKGAWAIVERVRTGEILAMASRPAYDLNGFRTSEEDARLNRCVGYVYEPGSTFKVAVVAAALNEGVTTPHTIYDCENGVWIYRGKPLRDYHPYGNLATADVIKKSSNIGAAKIAIQLGEQRLYSYLRAFGIGSPTNVELPGEEGGILASPKRWNALSISRIAMGHEVALTSLQMLNLLCAIGNEGFLMRPQIVRKVVAPDGTTIHEPQPEVLSRPIRADTAHLMCKLLTRVTEDGGTATKARIEGFTVAGKTGTAQKPVPGGYSDTANIASFMGLVPAEQPELGIIVVIDEPRKVHTGGQVAAPVFKEIAEQAVRYLDIPPVPEEKAYRFGNEIPDAET